MKKFFIIAIGLVFSMPLGAAKLDYDKARQAIISGVATMEVLKENPLIKPLIITSIETSDSPVRHEIPTGAKIGQITAEYIQIGANKHKFDKIYSGVTIKGGGYIIYEWAGGFMLVENDRKGGQSCFILASTGDYISINIR